MTNSDGLLLYRETQSADRTHATAVVKWMGYDAPGFSNVASANSARHGAHLLMADVAALRATHQPGAYDLTVVGHSYGSTTVADACTDGMRPTNVVLLGSPGPDHAHHAKDLGIGASHVYVGSASRDPVTWAHDKTGGLHAGSLGLGTDPALKDFGATRFDAEATNRDTNKGFMHYGDHSLYYKPGGESLYDITDIVTGHGNHILTDGMRPLLRVRHDPRTARPRPTPRNPHRAGRG